MGSIKTRSPRYNQYRAFAIGLAMLPFIVELPRALHGPRKRDRKGYACDMKERQEEGTEGCAKNIT